LELTIIFDSLGQVFLNVCETALERHDETGAGDVFLLELTGEAASSETFVGRDHIFDVERLLVYGLQGGARAEDLTVEQGIEDDAGASAGPLQASDFVDNFLFMFVGNAVFGEVAVEEVVEGEALFVEETGGVRRYEEFEGAGALAVLDGVAFGFFFSRGTLGAF
jgi:hypothetical protein